MGYQHWHFTKDKEGTAWLEIDVKDSSVNILRVEVMQEWAEIMKEVAADSSLTGLCMVSGKPGGFVYGADIAEFNTLASEADVHNLIALAASVLSAIEKLDIPTVCGSLREALESLDADREYLTSGDVFTNDQIDAYIELKMEEVYAFEHTPHPIEFQMYYSS